jgi:two-component system capsular synthesis response regulator RcsB
MSLRILLADDHPVIAAAVRARLQGQTGWEVCAEVTNATELLHAVDQLQPDIVVTDYHMPGVGERDGYQLMSALRRRRPTLGVIVLTMITNPLLLRNILDTRVQGLLLKDSPLSELVTAVARVQGGLTYIGKSALAALSQCGQALPPQRGRRPRVRLSVRELEVLRLYLAGQSVTEIAESLRRSVKTISRQKQCAMVKLGVNNERELFACAAVQGVLLPMCG